MTLTELIEVVQEQNFTSANRAAKIVNCVFEVVRDTLLNGEDFSCRGLGKLKVVERAARTARNPKTGDKVQVPAKKSVTFKPSIKLVEDLNNV